MTFRSKTILGIALIQLILLIFAIPSQLKVLKDSHYSELQEKANSTVQLFSSLAVTPVITTDLATLDSIIQQLLKDTSVSSIKIYNGEKQLLAEGHTQTTQAFIESTPLEVHSPIGDASLNIGHIEALFSTAHLHQNIDNSLHATLVIGFVSLCIAILFAYTLGSLLSRRLKRLEAGAQLIGEGRLGYQIDITGQDEIARTITTFNQMSQRINELYREQKRINKIFYALNNAQNQYIASAGQNAVFSELLESIIELTESEYGFIGEVLYKDGSPYLHTFSITNIAWDEDTRSFYEDHKDSGFEFYNLNTLFGSTLTTGLPVITNDPSNDSRASGIPSGHPPLNCFLGMPLYNGTKLIGMIGLANRIEGYSHALVDEYQALWNVSASMITASKNELNRQQMEKELRESEERFALVAKGTNDGMWDWNLQTGEIYYSSRWNEMLGYADSEITPRFEIWQELIHPDDLGPSLETWTQCMEGKLDAFNFEYRVRHKNGKYLWILCRGTVFKNPQGRAMRMAGSHSDVTRQKESELALEQSARRTKAILDNVVDVIMMLNSDGVIEDCNPAINTTLLYTPEEVVGKRLSEFVDIDLEDTLKGNSTPNETSFELNARRKDRSEFPVDIQVSPIPSDENLHKYVCVLRDITQRKKTELAIREAHEAALDAARTKTEFLANMSHEIRTPLHGIIGMVQMTEQTTLTEKQKNYLSTAHKSATHLLGIINDILDVSKIEAGKLEIEYISFNLRELLEDVTHLYAQQAHEKNLLIEYIMPANVPDFYYGDPARLKQIFTNLVSNAIKFTDNGSVLIKVSMISQSTDSIDLRIEVVDTGIGIPQDAQEKVFQSFQQADSSMARQFGGTGLGLTICKQLAELMNGSISLESKQGKGSRFIFAANFRLAQDVNLYTIKPLENKSALILDNNNCISTHVIADYLKHWKLNVSIDQFNPDNNELTNNDAQYVFIHQEQFTSKQWSKALEQHKNKENILIAIIDHIERSAENTPENLRFLGKPLRQSDVYNILVSDISEDLKILGRNEHSLENYHFEGQVLLVEDNPVNQEVSRELLLQLGLSVDIAENGKKAVEAVQSQDYDLILMDCQMPEMDGYEATIRIRQLHDAGTAKKCNIIALTANAMKGDREKCLAVGMNDHLAKPFTLQQLIETLSRWLPVHEKGFLLSEPQQETDNNSECKAGEPSPMDNVIDHAIVNSLRSILKDKFPAMLEKFETNAIKLIEEMNTALDSDNSEDLRRAAHTLKGSSGTIGAQRLSEACLKLEKLAKDGVPNEARELISTIHSEFKNFQGYIPDLKAA